MQCWGFSHSKKGLICIAMNKTKQINVRLTEEQLKVLQSLVDDGTVKTQSAAMMYLINQYAILGKK